LPELLTDLTISGNRGALIGIRVDVAAIQTAVARHNIIAVVIGSDLRSGPLNLRLANPACITETFSKNSIAGTLYLFGEDAKKIVPRATTFLFNPGNFQKALRLRGENHSDYKEEIETLIETAAKEDRHDDAVEALEFFITQFPEETYYSPRLVKLLAEAWAIEPAREALKKVPAGTPGLKSLKQLINKEERAKQTDIRNRWQQAQEGNFLPLQAIGYLDPFLAARIQCPASDMDLVTICRLTKEEKYSAFHLMALGKLYERVWERKIADRRVVGFLEEVALNDEYIMVWDEKKKAEALKRTLKNQELLLRFYDHNFQGHLNLGIGLAVRRDFYRAEKEFELALEAFPGNAEVLGNLSLCRGRMGYAPLEQARKTRKKPEQTDLIKEAQDCFERSLHYNPNNIETLGWYLVADTLTGNYYSMEAHSRALIEIIGDGRLANDPSFKKVDPSRLKITALFHLGQALLGRFAAEGNPDLLEEADNTLTPLATQELQVAKTILAFVKIVKGEKGTITKELLDKAPPSIREMLSRYL